MFKRFISFILVCVLAMSVVGCGGSEETAGSESNDSKSGVADQAKDGGKEAADPATMEMEAPMLAEKVKAGELPVVEERLPVTSDIMIEPDVMELGNYGGSITITQDDHARWKWGPYTEQSMFRFKQDGSGEVEANVCKDFYANDDSTVWTIELREGMKWSDGEPFTADDVIFYYDHMSTPALNEDRTPVPVDDPGYYNSFTTKPYRAYYVEKDGQTYWAEFEKIDDYKITVTFAAPKPLFPESVAIDNKWMFAPKHIYKDFVARKDGVTDDPTFPLITEEQAIDNANKFLDRQWDSYSKMGKGVGYYSWDYYQIPSLRSFVAVDKNNWDKVGETYELVRNPYFFKTDSAGRQLPYLDSIKVQIINELDQRTLKAVAGEFDVHELVQSEFSVIASSTKDTHRFTTWSISDWASYGIELNQTHKDLDKRALYQDIKFREALSIAVDRELLSATLTKNQLKPWQSSPVEGILGHDEEWSEKWTAYDVDGANALLDEITEPWDKAEGTYRKYKGTNNDIEMVFHLREEDLDKYGEFLALLQTAYKNVGIKVSDKVVAEHAKMILANEHDVVIGTPGGVTPVLRPDNMLPMRNYSAWYGAYGKWYEDNKSDANGGIAPTGDMLALVEAYDTIRSATGPDRDVIVKENVQKIYDLHKENIWSIGYLSPEPGRWLVNNNLMNFPDNIAKCDEYRWASMMRPEQLYWAE
ncbi:ABC transporter substrate-binding protein [Vallitalea okinawensis]|uniref:ABC transporter substrate-binding protein n=1 Tax=Vallitalea okinawensis TaxID=2078660 RepID=UPI001300AC23|nr:ABC transporter substrate-binding protein [Vallitalea okinawensis]